MANKNVKIVTQHTNETEVHEQCTYHALHSEAVSLFKSTACNKSEQVETSSYAQ